MQSKVITIGTTGKCDIKLNAKGVHPVHASIEQNPSSGTFWLKDHSLAGRTTVNGHYVHGEVELHNGDLVRIGRAQPFVFEKRSLIPLNGNSVIDDAPVEKDMSKSAMFPVLGTKIIVKKLAVRHRLPRSRAIPSLHYRPCRQIDQLRRQKSYPEAVSPPTKAHPYYLPFLQEMPSAGGTPIGRNFELETYRAFLGTVAAKIRSFND
nr:Forkhead-associated domain containing protein [Haemonchus contortus]